VGTIVSGLHTTGITLNSTPGTIAGTIDLAGTNAIAVFGSVSSTLWNVINLGVIDGSLAGDIGIQIDGGGTVYNGTAAGSTVEITAYSYGVELGATRTLTAGLLVNYGTIVSLGAVQPSAVALDAGGQVINAAGALISGQYYAVYTGTTASTVSNAGSISGGILLGHGGTVSNAASGTITGMNAIYGSYLAGATVLNAGVIKGGNAASANGIVLDDGGSLVNAAGGTVQGNTGIYVGTTIGSITNSGIIRGTEGSGVVLAQGGAVSNAGAGRIRAAVYGVEMRDTGTLGSGTVSNAGYIGGLVGIDFASFAGGSETVINSGTIASTLGLSGNAIVFTNTADRLVVDKGADFIGTVVGAGILELASSAGLGTLSGLGSQFIGFSTIAIDAGDSWFIGGNSAGFNGTITGFTLGDTLDIGGISATTPIFAANTLTLESGSGAVVDTLAIIGSFGTAQFQLQTDHAGGTLIDLQVPCFVKGTRIATPSGDIPVEQLAIGDHVLLLCGRSKPVRWIGRRSYNGRFVAGRADVLPILVRADALADGIPRRDLMISPLHALYLDGMLVPAGLLVNGLSIVQIGSIATLEYWHVELDSHDVLLAEGAPAESFVDDNSRNLFHNAADYNRLYPDAQARPARYCARRVQGGPALELVRHRLATRAEAQILPGPLDGRVDTVDEHRVTGWAFDSARPQTPVVLEILDAGTVIGEVVADRYRADLAQAGIGSGHCSFIFPSQGSPRVRRIQARRKSDGAEIPSAPILWQRQA
jgi:hypothetical protein